MNKVIINDNWLRRDNVNDHEEEKKRGKKEENE